LFAIVDQGLKLQGRALYDGRLEALAALYALPQSDFHDITTGSSQGFPALPGFDLVTGRGTPIANTIVQAMQHFVGPQLTSAAVNSGGTLLDFAVTPGNTVYGHDNSGWHAFGQGIKYISPVSDVNGNVTVFVITTDNALDSWSGFTGAQGVLAGHWRLLGGSGTDLTVSGGTDASGQADAFVIPADYSMTEWKQSGWIGYALSAPGGTVNMSAIGGNAVIAVEANGQVFEHNDASGWFALTGSNFGANSVSAINDTHGNTVVYAQTLDGGLWRYVLGGGWAELFGPTVSGAQIQAFSAALDSGGYDTVFLVTNTATYLTQNQLDQLAEYDSHTGGTAYFTFQAPSQASEEVSGTAGDYYFSVFSDGSINWGQLVNLTLYPLASGGFAQI
jgi:hypothetical protein